ncbi:MAG: NADH-quinone oxidoreductase subunit J [Candidatus Hydrogenedentota bacterium]|nr:MAG: NADH-quinone oxidoreductase subunit J [Candidatus Hydrogenedentota bacterium]
MLATGLYAFLAAVTVGFAVAVVKSREIFRATFALLGTLCGVAGLLAFYGATTIAALQVLIYVGAVFVLFLFAILVTDRPAERLFRTGVLPPALALFASAGLAALLIAIVPGMAGKVPGGRIPALAGGVIGRAFLQQYLLTFEVIGVLLLIGLIAAVLIIRKEIRR